MITLNIFIAFCITVIVISILIMVDFYPVHNKQTKRIEWWITYWSRSEERYIKFKLFERKIRK